MKTLDRACADELRELEQAMTDDLWHEIHQHVQIRPDGAIVYDSRLSRRLLADGINEKLHLCVEDNIVDGPDGEEIDWDGVMTDYAEMEAR